MIGFSDGNGLILSISLFNPARLRSARTASSDGHSPAVEEDLGGSFDVEYRRRASCRSTAADRDYSIARELGATLVILLGSIDLSVEAIVSGQARFGLSRVRLAR
ncbi:hypothetical protein P3C58_21380 [Mesorhizobium sp. XAP10]|uniref:hypothetical protein n=1 Tax=unclassified Mesorhizobium TaxID=325217 RepID=UPI0023E0003A|nr:MULTISPECIES: hypothetical protein [unclassified Mesorhizobium]MDF3154536.1 hypothetical protein [Mesorhizobium sp. XAP10]MDF3247914.1 hypothetical protein [Mesorhizobium sp. XAP4]